MAQRNPTREIAISLAAAAVFGIGLAVYIRSSISQSLRTSLVTDTPSPSSDVLPKAPARSDMARAVATTFVTHLAASDYERAYQQMAGAYRSNTSLDAFRAACIASPFLSTARSVSLPRTREEFAPGQKQGSLSASGVMTTGPGAIDVTFSFVDDGAGVAIINVSVAGAPALAMGIGVRSAKSAAPSKTVSPVIRAQQ